MAGKRLASKLREKSKPRSPIPWDDEPDAENTLQCRGCKFVGLMGDFLKDDPGDTKCPRCGSDDHTVLL